ncbi:hypothetical protein J6P92_09560 [bacterium]|nr:hypothetical protein [bacterium]
MKNFLFIVGLTAFLTLPACAEFTVDDTVDGAYLKNHGHSDTIIYVTNKKIAEANGEAYSRPVESELYEVPVVKYVRKFFMYIDPALDDEKFVNNHQISPTSKWSDL